MPAPIPTLRVQGHGEAASEPDVVVLHFDITAQHHEYGETISALNERTDALRSSVRSGGEDPDELKTTSFNLNVHSEYENRRYTFRGFQGTHRLDLRLAFDRDRLDKVFASVVDSKAKATMRISFTVADAEAVRRQVLANAVANARERAEIIAAAAGQRLGRIVHIEHGYTEIHVSSPDFGLAMADAPGAPAAPSIRPADIQSEDSVLVVWEVAPL